MGTINARYDDHSLAVGDIVHLIYEDPQTGSNANAGYRVQRVPVRTNLGGEERTYGWLGTTNNTAAYAEGRAKIVGFIPDYETRDGEPRARVRRIKR